jgi:hypothetical protein
MNRQDVSSHIRDDHIGFVEIRCISDEARGPFRESNTVEKHIIPRNAGMSDSDRCLWDRGRKTYAKGHVLINRDPGVFVGDPKRFHVRILFRDHVHVSSPLS